MRRVRRVALVRIAGQSITGIREDNLSMKKDDKLDLERVL